MSIQKRLESAQEYTIGWIAALPLELAAATAMLDEEHRRPSGFKQPVNDANHYTWGAVGEHNVVVASLVSGRYGTVSATITASSMRSSLPHLRFCLLVGIGAGVPDLDKDIDIRLGDVVVSHPSGSSSGVVQYDLGKVKPNGKFELVGSLRSPPDVLLNAVAKLQSQHIRQRRSQIHEILKDVYTREPQMQLPDDDGMPGFVHQGAHKDRLFDPSCSHNVAESNEDSSDESTPSCRTCEASKEIKRKKRRTTVPRIFYGTVASGNYVIKDGIKKDEIMARLDFTCLCFEMEAAGLMNAFPCIVIRGICDYADSHKNDRWQPYAAATAAAYAKELLQVVDPQEVVKTASIEQATKELVSQLQDGFETTRNLIQDPNHGDVLLRLYTAENAIFDSHDEKENPVCLKMTRTGLLNEIYSWTRDDEGRSIFWLRGGAGTGKSTISRTLAHTLSARKRLGASFFFKRDERLRSSPVRFFATIAYQLAHWVPFLYKHVATAFESNPDIAERALVDQFNTLILEPLACLSAERPAKSSADTYVVVIDALDECDTELNARTIIQLLSRAHSQTLLRCYVTCRPEYPLLEEFSRMDRAILQDIDLHEVTKTNIDADITTFLFHEFSLIKEQHVRRLYLEKTWPPLDSIQKLAQLASPLFIFAATVCRHIRETGDPQERLQELLHDPRYVTMSGMERTYLPLLDYLLRDMDDFQRDARIRQFQAVVGAVLVAFEPLSANMLASLGFGSELDILGSLHSVLDVPASADKPVRMLHLSFRDFLIGKSLQSPVEPTRQCFHIDEAFANHTMYMRCLTILSDPRRLFRDICGLRAPGTKRHEVAKDIIESSILPDLSYACRYWVDHFQKSGQRIHDQDAVHEFLKSHLLPWIEAMTWLGEFRRCVANLETLETLAMQHGAEEAVSFLYDARRFIVTNHHVIRLAPLQVYSSALIFSPQNSLIRQHSHVDVPSWMSSGPQTLSDWSARRLEITDSGHPWRDPDVINADLISFSPDSRIVASVVNKVIHLLDSRTGVSIQQLRGHTDKIICTSFSTQSDQLTSITMDGRTVIWDVKTGLLIREHWCDVNPDMDIFARLSCITVVIDGTLIAMVASSNMVRVLDAESLKPVNTLVAQDGKFGEVSRLMFSPVATFLVMVLRNQKLVIWNLQSGSSDTVEQDVDCYSAIPLFTPDGRLLTSVGERGPVLWDISPFSEVREFKGQPDNIGSMSLSADGQLLASATWCESAMVWDITSGAQLYHMKDLGTAVLFSPYSWLLAVNSLETKQVLVWNLEPEQEQQPKLLGTGFMSMSFLPVWAFSPDGKTLVGSNISAHLSLWDVEKATEYRTRSTLKNAISHDGRLLASVHFDRGSVGVWDVAKGELICQLENRLDRLGRVAFSSSNDFLYFSSNKSTFDYAGWWIQSLKDRRLYTSPGRNAVEMVLFRSSDGDGPVVRNFSDKLIDESKIDVRFTMETYAMSMCDTLLAACGQYRTQVVIVNALDGSEVVRLRKTEGIWDIEPGLLSPCGSYYYASMLKVVAEVKLWGIYVWDVASGEEIQFLGLRDMHLKLNRLTPQQCCVVTDIGVVHLDKLCRLPGHDWQQGGVGLSIPGEWMQYRGEDQLWLPNEYRGDVTTSFDGTIAVSQNNGDITLYDGVRARTIRPDWNFEETKEETLDEDDGFVVVRDSD